MMNAYNFATLVESLQVGVVVQRPDTTIIMCNPKARELLGLTDDQLLGKTALDPTWNIIHEGGTEFAGSDHPSSRSIATGQPVRDVVMGVYRPPYKDRVWLLVNADPQLNSDGVVQQVVVTFTDITAKKRIEKEKARAEEWLKIAIDCSQIALWDLNIATGHVAISREWNELLGYKPDELVLDYPEWESRLHPDDIGPTLSSLQSHLANRDVKYDVEYRLRHKDGSWVWIYGRGEAIRDVQGQPVSMLGCGIVITERKKIEEQLRAAHNRLEYLSRQLIKNREAECSHLAGELHDELAQVLVAIKMNTRMIQSIADEGIRHSLEENISLIDQSLSQVRDIALNLRPLHLEPLGLVATLHWYANKQAKITGIPIDLRFIPDEIQLSLELATVCFRIVQESLTNALRHASPQRIGVEVHLQDRELLLIITDDGIGFDVSKAFDNSSGNRKFGLSGMTERAALIGGKIDIQSAPGNGTRIQARFHL